MFAEDSGLMVGAVPDFGDSKFMPQVGMVSLVSNEDNKNDETHSNPPLGTNKFGMGRAPEKSYEELFGPNGDKNDFFKYYFR